MIPGGAKWEKAFGPELRDVFTPPCLVKGKGAVPCKNTVEKNSYCKARHAHLPPAMRTARTP